MKRIRGQLHGGYASCTYPYSDYYGRLSMSWNFDTDPTKSLETHLDPMGTGMVVTDAIPLKEARARHTAQQQKRKAASTSSP